MEIKKASSKRLSVVDNIPLLSVDSSAVRLAGLFLDNNHLPRKSAADALHIAIATVHGIDYLLTWNCRHIANAEIQKSLRKTAQQEGYELPLLCTPNELMGNEDDLE